MTALIRAELDAAGGWLDFADYMRLALYAPGLGYYSAGAQKFGPAGDFITAPELGPAFARCLARALAPVLRALPNARILELGAGTGALAADLLTALVAADAAPAAYDILEVSADLAQRQRRRLAETATGFAGSLSWLDALPDDGFEGVVLANEVLDALPVSRFRIANGVPLALGVGWSDGRFCWLERPATAAQRAVVERLAADLPAAQWPEGYCSEYCPGLTSWLAAVTRPLRRGLLLAVDYGLPRREYYHWQRSAGTLICHYRHRAHADPFVYPGLQDISAWVDFTAVAEAAQAAGLQPDAYGTQAGFLLANGIADDPDLLAADSPAMASAAAALRQLLLPGEMGETFKVFAAGRGLAAGALDVGRDLSHLL